LRITVQFAKEPFAIFGSPISEIIDEGLDEVSTGVPKYFGPAEIRRIAFYKRGIELVFADQQAEAVTEARLAVLVAVVPVRGRRVLIRSVSARRSRRPPEFLDRAEADAVGFAESTVDGAGLSHTHLGAANKWRDIRGVSIAIANEAPRSGGLIDGGPKNPTAGRRVGQATLNDCVDPGTPSPLSYPQ
jgi:hypothetical protein